MNKYWSNEDDEKVSYPSEYPQRDPGGDSAAQAPVRRAAAHRTDERAAAAFSANQSLNRREKRSGYPDESAYPPNYSPDRSSFIAEELNDRQRGDVQFAPPPRFSQETPERPPEAYAFGDGYQVRSEQAPVAHSGGRKRGWLIALIVVLALLLIGCGAYIFRVSDPGFGRAGVRRGSGMENPTHARAYAGGGQCALVCQVVHAGS